MEPAAGLTIIDTSVFIIDLRYKRDRNFGVNRAFLDRIAQEGNGATSILNLLEVCGILSFNLNEKQLRELFFYLPEHYRVEVFPDASLANRIPSFKVGDLFDIIARKASFGDALIISSIQAHIPRAGRFVSWNSQHFTGHLSIPSLNPREYLQ